MNRAWVLSATAIVLSACNIAPHTVPSTPSVSAPRRLDLTGAWVLTTTSQMGANDVEMVLAHSGRTLQGTVTGAMGQAPLAGSVHGAAVKFSFKLSAQGAPVQVEYTGVVDGDTMQGTAVFGAFGEGAFTAKRKRS